MGHFRAMAGPWTVAGPKRTVVLMDYVLRLFFPPDQCRQRKWGYLDCLENDAFHVHGATSNSFVFQLFMIIQDVHLHHSRTTGLGYNDDVKLMAGNLAPSPNYLPTTRYRGYLHLVQRLHEGDWCRSIRRRLR